MFQNFEKKVELIGVPWDSNTLGRLGAADGPSSIKRELSKIHLYNSSIKRNIPAFEIKELEYTDEFWSMCQTVDKTISSKLDRNEFVATVGGNHSVSYQSFKTFKKYFKEISLINVDSHLDVREISHGPTNGNWIRMLREETKFNCLEIGTGLFSNDEDLFKYAEENSINIMTLQNLRTKYGKKKLERFIDQLEGQDVYLSIDIDVLDQSVAPGVSAPSPDGMSLEELKLVITTINRFSKIRTFDLMELNPKVDNSNITSRLAVYLIQFMISQLL